MAKIGKRTRSNWTIGVHAVNLYKNTVPDPAVKRKRRTSKEIRRVIAQALNRVQNDGWTVYLSARTYKGESKPKTLYRIELFKNDYYVLCVQQQVVTLFTADMIAGDAQRGELIFRDQAPFESLAAYYEWKLEENLKAGEGGALAEWAERITMSGVVEVEAGSASTDPVEGESTDDSDIAVATVEAGIGAKIVDHVSGDILFLYEDGRKNKQFGSIHKIPDP